MSQLTFLLKVIFVIICTMCIDVCSPQDQFDSDPNQVNLPNRKDTKNVLGKNQDNDENEDGNELSSSSQKKPPSSGNEHKKYDEVIKPPNRGKLLTNHAISSASTKANFSPPGAVAGASSKNNRNATRQSGTRRMSANTTLQNTRANKVTSSSPESKAPPGVEKTQKNPQNEVARKKKATHDNDLGNKKEEKSDALVTVNAKPKKPERGNEQKNDTVNKGIEASQSRTESASKKMVLSGVSSRSSSGSNATSLTKSRNASVPSQPKSAENDQKMDTANKKSHNTRKNKEKMHQNSRDEADMKDSKSQDAAKEPLKKKEAHKLNYGQRNHPGNDIEKSDQNKGSEEENKTDEERSLHKKGKDKKRDGKRNRSQKETTTGKHSHEREENRDNDSGKDKNRKSFMDRGSTNKQRRRKGEGKVKGNNEQGIGGQRTSKDTNKTKETNHRAEKKGQNKTIKSPIDDSKRKPKKNEMKERKKGADKTDRISEEFGQDDLDNKIFGNEEEKKLKDVPKGMDVPKGIFNKKLSQRRGSHLSRGGVETDGTTGSSHFIVYGTVGLILLIVLYIVYQKRQKINTRILALIVEGRRRGVSGSGERSRRGSGNVAYRPLPTKEADEAAARPESLQKYIY